MRHLLHQHRRAATIFALAMIAVLLASPLQQVSTTAIAAPASQTTDGRFFVATQHLLAEPFLTAYDTMGSELRFGAPLTEAWEQDGNRYQVFQNGRLEQFAGGTVQVTALGSSLTAGRPADPAVSVGPEGPGGQYILETGHTVRAPFVDHWVSTDGWFRLGKPISEVMDEGGVQVQYFEFAKLIADVTYAGGVREQLQDNARSAGSPFSPVGASTDLTALFDNVTGHNVTGGFLEVYNMAVGASSLGSPLTDETLENGIPVQYFQMGKLEYHADRPAGQQVILAPLGAAWLLVNTVPAQALEAQKEPTATPTAIPTDTATPTVTETPVPAATSTPQPTATPATSASGVPAGWKEIARGHSKFAGSTAARTTNIRVAAQKIDGDIIQPGATYSFNKSLGDDTERAGFVTSLVIYNGRTIPGVGGGICQVSTTVFRAAFYAGFDIVSRKAHSYRIASYEPPVGFDATVFADQGLDLKWRNNLNAPVMLKAYFDGKAGTIDIVLYSTADTLYKVSLDGPYTSNIIKHGAALYEDDPTLTKGVVKQVEYAKDGLDVTINRVLTDKTTGKVVATQKFFSHYVPWRDVYKRGTGTGGGSNTTVQKP